MVVTDVTDNPKQDVASIRVTFRLAEHLTSDGIIQEFS
jgi:hypothetical protein